MDDVGRRAKARGIGFIVALTLIFAISFLFKLGDAYRDGSPAEACNTMVPNPSHFHGHGALPSADRSPYSILVSNLRRQQVAEYTPGGKQVLKVRIHGPKYQGYLLQARTMTGSQRRVGEFLTPLPVESKFLDCDSDHPRSVVTHSCSAFKQHQTFFWRAPDMDVGPIYFVATIVADNRSVYWTLVQSAPLFPASKTVSADFVENTNRCGKGFGCIRVGEKNCVSIAGMQYTTDSPPTAATCNLTLSWQCSNTFAVFEMFAVRDRNLESAKGGTYAALILSKDAPMNNAELLTCELKRQEGLYRALSGSYQYHSKATSLRPLRENIIDLKTTVISDRYFYCRFSRPLDHTFDSKESSVTTDFQSPVFAHVAFGKTYTDGQLQSPATLDLMLPVLNGTSVTWSSLAVAPRAAADLIIVMTQTATIDDSRWWSRVSINPRTLALRVDERVPLTIGNRNGRPLTYKVKTTRHHSMFPNRTYGIVEGYQETIVKILYQPCEHDRPLKRSDHITIVLRPMPSGLTDARQVWQCSDERARGFRIDLRDDKRPRTRRCASHTQGATNTSCR